MSNPSRLQTRVGIATGLVVVGDLIGEGSAQEQSVVGETPNLAARLQGLAEPDAVVIAASTRRLVGDLFECRDRRTQAEPGASKTATPLFLRGSVELGSLLVAKQRQADVYLEFD